MRGGCNRAVHNEWQQHQSILMRRTANAAAAGERACKMQIHPTHRRGGRLLQRVQLLGGDVHRVHVIVIVQVALKDLTDLRKMKGVLLIRMIWPAGFIACMSFSSSR